MKKIILLITLLSATIIFISVQLSENIHTEETYDSMPRNGVALIITGAAARISQETALLEELDKRGLLKNLVFVSGVSSGALNSVVLNGILEGKITWDEYKSILFALKNSDIYTQEGKKLPVNTSPARELFRRITFDSLGYRSIGDLPVFTAISFSHLKRIGLKRYEYRMCSRKINKETDTTLNLVDVMMATSAVPVVFPPVRIENVKTIPDVEYIDGGVGDDRLPYQALLQFEKYRGRGVERVYIISRNCDSLPDLSEELKGFGINDKGVFDKLGVSLDAYLTRELIKRMKDFTTDAPELVPLTRVWMPRLDTDFLLFNFSNLEEQYNRTVEWAKTNDPVPIKDFLSQLKTTKN